MKRYVDKTAVFILCTFVYLQDKFDLYAVVPMICAVAASAFFSYRRSTVLGVSLYTAFCVGAALYPPLLFFLPVISYDVFTTERKYWALLGIIPAILCVGVLPATYLISAVLLTGLSFLLEHRTGEYERTKSEYIALQDAEKEFTLQLESKNRELLEKQDFEINIATLNERNRIARDIHDSIGHLLSNAILQTGAMLAVCRDEKMKSMLSTLKETLTAGMNSVRDSIHGLYDDSIDLYAETRAMTDHFDFCDIRLDYEIDENPDRNIRYALLYIIKEALSNVIRHSDAKAVTVTLREHPALYQLIVRDNGTKNSPAGEGIGLKNIEQRAAGLGGITNFGFENGFTVFVSIPKERQA